MKSEVRLRLLLDELRHPLGKDTGGKESFEAVLRAQQRRAFLLGKLRRIKAEHQETATRSAVQKEKERW